MKRAKLLFGLCGLALASLTRLVVAAEVQALDLKPFVGPSQLDRMNATWMFPRGRQILDGVPFQLDGVIELYGTSGAQQKNPGRTNVIDIPIGRSCEMVHLLSATDDTVAESNVVATVRLNYADGTDATIPVRFGFHVRRWVANRYRPPGDLKDSRTHIAWVGEHPEGARQNGYARLFHSVFTNPAPEKVVKSVSLESAKVRAGLWIAGISVGPASAAPLSNSMALATNLPDLRPHTGATRSIRGVVRAQDGTPLPGIRISVTGMRPLDTSERETQPFEIPDASEILTDAGGNFSLPPVPDNQVYTVLAVGSEFEPMFYRGADPMAEPIELRLVLATEPKLQQYTAHGKVVGLDGLPVAGALVEFNAVNNDGYGSSFSSGSYAGFADETVTRANGEFVMTRSKSFVGVQVEITGPGHAPMKVWLEPTNGVQIIQLKAGCVVRGRLLLHRGPLAGVQVGVSGQNRDSSVFAGYFTTTTRADGTFEFKHLQPATAWWLYGKMNSLKRDGAVRPRAVTTLQSGTEVDLGDIEVVPGLRLAGTVRTRSGEPLPDGIKLTVSWEEAWDSQVVSVDTNGGFEFAGLATGLMNLSLNLQNWHLSAVNRSLDNWNSWRLLGLVERDKTDLQLVIERGQRQYDNRGNMGNGNLLMEDQAQSLPIAGAEPSGGPMLTFVGKVLDDATGKPVASFNLIPGRKPPVQTRGTPAKPMLQRLTEPFRQKVVPWNEMIWWDYAREQGGTNGAFSIDFALLKSGPVLKIEAPGYDPLLSEPLETPTNGLVFRLSKGVGPAGVVLLPDGKPAAGATVIYGATHQQFSLNQTSLSAHDGTNWYRRTGADGKFSFPPQENGEQLFVAHTNGWLSQPAKNGKTGLKLRLEPWGVVKGVLQQSNGPVMAGVRLHLGGNYDGQRPYINTGLNCITDASGRFLFTNVPTGRLALNRTIPMGGGSYQHRLQTWLDVEAGVTNDLKTVYYDSPPPLPVLEQIKNTLGL